VEYAFLCGPISSIQGAALRTFDRVDLLTHTGVVMIEKGANKTLSPAITKEFVLSNQDRPWGLELPNCPTCQTNVDMMAIFNKKDQGCKLRCLRCTSSSKGITRPSFVKPCDESHLRPNRYFIIPFPIIGGLAVDKKTWVIKPFKDVEQLPPA
jgi:hypothetical protein